MPLAFKVSEPREGAEILYKNGRKGKSQNLLYINGRKGTYLYGSPCKARRTTGGVGAGGPSKPPEVSGVATMDDLDFPDDADGRFDDADEDDEVATAESAGEDTLFGDQLKLLPFLVSSGRAAGSSVVCICSSER